MAFSLDQSDELSMLDGDNRSIYIRGIDCTISETALLLFG